MLVVSSPFLDIIDEQGMGAIMKNSALRYTYIEHPFSMLICVVLMTIINKKVKTSERISVGIAVMALIAIALFAYAIPFAKLFNS